MNRRELLWSLGLLGTAVPFRRVLAAQPPTGDLEVLDLELPGDARLARRSVVLVPAHAGAEGPLPVLVLLHGLGETGSAIRGIHAWGERYGLVRAYERLRRPPVVRTELRQPYLSEERAAAINSDLAARPFQPLVVVCPVTPNPGRHPSAERALDVYAAWIDQTLLPEVGRRVQRADLERVGLDGCSLGGYVALEVYLRRPERFSSFGTVQAAFGMHRVQPYAKRISESRRGRGVLPLHIETSTEDPYRKPNERLSRDLVELGVPNELAVLPGHHNQPWLREIGGLEMLRWHSAELWARGARVSAKTPRRRG